ncbi:MAG: pyridoxamine 5'-phosphate oxidase family protein [Marinovum sp.]|nr:pyridoxamine 5'-phosphate oxidase family protein [Marinovum sp.]
MRKIETLEALHALYKTPSDAALHKVADHLTPLYRKWIEGARFCVVSTVGPEGADGSPRGDDGPVVRFHDDKTLMMPDWRGNNRLDTLRNIVRDGRIALMFMVSGSKTIVRVNGRAWLTDDEAVCQQFEKRSKHPKTVIVIEIDEIYTQCAKAVMRAGLWERDDSASVPTMGDILLEMTKGKFGGAEYDAAYGDYAKPRMW